MTPKTTPTRWQGLLGGLRRFVSAVGPTFVVIAALEILFRIGASVAHGGSEYYLLYGLHGIAGRVGISPWSLYDGGYYKFPANYVLKGAAGQGLAETASINSLGFRSPDFQPHKPPGTFRVISLGESSTFGFHNSDTGTYPFQLEQMLRSHPSPLRVEVINAGFPYYNSASILSLLRNELAGYDPDLLTLYSGYNDCGWPLELRPGYRAVLWVQQHSAIYLVVKETILPDRRLLKLRAHLLKRFRQPDEATIDRQAQRIAERYRENLRAIVALAEQRNIPLVLIRQPMTTDFDPKKRRPDYSSYENEYRIVRKKMVEGGLLSGFELNLLFHHRLLQEFDAIALEERLPVVDNVAIVDQNRSRLASHVHLTEEANARLAEALMPVIAPYVTAAETRPRSDAPPAAR